MNLPLWSIVVMFLGGPPHTPTLSVEIVPMSLAAGTRSAAIYIDSPAKASIKLCSYSINQTGQSMQISLLAGRYVSHTCGGADLATSIGEGRTLLFVVPFSSDAMRLSYSMSFLYTEDGLQPRDVDTDGALQLRDWKDGNK